MERTDGDTSLSTPPRLEKAVAKSDTAAINLGIEMLRKAEALIDEWYEKGKR
ncbi:hypothetical protein P3T23_000020 [Paraburkholderia sp. GAS448]|jgi:hypothetical protein|uniref:hypothetical protein n=1 Tax=Paraburkholderia sp. GAS448 TaxID=3035136 RepID=UPI003D1F31E8